MDLTLLQGGRNCLWKSLPVSQTKRANRVALTVKAALEKNPAADFPGCRLMDMGQ